MINYDEIARATSAGDSEAEGSGFDATLQKLGVIPDDAMAVAQQRALRAYLLKHGKEIPKTMVPVKVDIEAGGFDEITSLSATWLDGLVTGLRLMGSVMGRPYPDNQNRRGGI